MLKYAQINLNKHPKIAIVADVQLGEHKQVEKM